MASRLLRPRAARRVDVECCPVIPSYKEVIWKVALLAGMRLVPSSATTHAEKHQRVRLFWGGRTGVDPMMRRWPMQDWLHALNANIGDTGKRNVARVFAETFGYGTAVDPTSHLGMCVAKSDANSAHDGRVVNCPIVSADPDLAYEVLVDNRIGQEEVLDLRVSVVGNELPLVYLKR